MPNIYLPGVIQIPSALLITNMTQSSPLVITISIPPTTAANTYIPGQNVRLTVPRTWGMYQANGLTVTIISIDGLNFTVNIDSTNFDPFIYAVDSNETPASLAPAGSINVQFSNNTDELPFQSLNNIGN